MNKSNSIETIDRTILTNHTKFWLDEISKIENENEKYEIMRLSSVKSKI